jgi:hypothetical protein
MTRGAAWSVHAAALLVGGTGLVYGWMRYCLEPADEFALVNHPAQPLWQHAHIVLAPLLVFACGLVWGEHVWRRVRTGFREGRSTGLALFALFFPMVLSGALVQVAEEPGTRAFAVYTHAASGTLWCLVYLVHLVRFLRARRRAEPGAELPQRPSRANQ